MAKVDVIMPQMGESIAEGTLSRWMKKVGDAVKRDEPIFEISTDKVDAEIPAPQAGVLVEILVQEVVRHAKEKLGVRQVEEFETVKENVSFSLPQELKTLLKPASREAV